MDIALVSVTAISLTMAFAMGIVAWRIIREERRRSDVRVASLLTQLGRPPDPSGDVSSGLHTHGRVPPPPLETPVPDPPSEPRPRRLFAAVTGPSVLLRPFLATIGGVGIVLALGTVAMLSGRDTPPPALSERATPVELLSLAHAKQGEYLAITGAVRNPADGVDRGRLSVMATVFDRDGTLIGTGQTPLPVRALAPGGETPFTISMPEADRINRYRISFAQDQIGVPHIDRRETPDAAVTTPPMAGGQP